MSKYSGQSSWTPSTSTPPPRRPLMPWRRTSWATKVSQQQSAARQWSAAWRGRPPACRGLDGRGRRRCRCLRTDRRGRHLRAAGTAPTVSGTWVSLPRRRLRRSGKVDPAPDGTSCPECSRQRCGTTGAPCQNSRCHRRSAWHMMSWATPCAAAADVAAIWVLPPGRWASAAVSSPEGRCRSETPCHTYNKHIAVVSRIKHTHQNYSCARLIVVYGQCIIQWNDW